MDIKEYLDSLTPEQLAVEIATQKLAELRRERDRRIAETDFWVLPDRTATQTQLDYRQALRDITQNASDILNVQWPTKPGA